jgi:hypothetical protein
MDLMATRDAVEAMMAIMKNEEMYGDDEYPVWIERTAVGSSMQALLQGLTQLDIGGQIAVRVIARMAEVRTFGTPVRFHPFHVMALLLAFERYP